MTMQQKTTTAVSGMAAAIASAGIIQKMGEIGTACVNAAADLQQSVGGVETVFGDSAKQMLAWSDQAAQSVGLSKNEYNEFATLVGSQLQNFGMSVEDSAAKTNDLISLGADLSSMFGGTTADAVDALSAALKGEMDPIEKYGISLNDATLKAQAASMGLGDLYAAGDRNAKMQATLAAITAQSGKAVGNFAREADTAQGQQQRMAAAFENAKAALGEALLPALTAAAAALAQMAQWVQANASWLTPLAIALGVAAAAVLAVNAAMSAYAAVAAVVAVAQGAVNLAFLPIIAIIAAIIAVIILCVKYWDQIKAAGAAAADWIMQRMQALYDMLPPGAQTALQFIGNMFNWLKGLVTGDHQAMAQAAQNMYNALPGWAQTGVQLAGNAFSLLKSAATGDFDGVKQAAQNMFDLLPGWAQNAINGVIGFFRNMYDTVAGFFSGISDMINGAISWVGGLIDKISGAKSAAASIPSAQAATYALQPATYMMSRSIQPLAAAGDTMARARATMPSARTAYRAGASLVKPARRQVVINLTVPVESPIMTPSMEPEVGKAIYKSLKAWANTYGKSLL
nr:MAG TPA: tail tape measure [Caudoviricetes sp.]